MAPEMNPSAAVAVNGEVNGDGQLVVVTDAAGVAQPQGQMVVADQGLLARQSSIYALTLDEFQSTYSDNGRNFGTMNMEEFLNSIWMAEEIQAQAQAQAQALVPAPVPAAPQLPSASTTRALVRQPSIIPEPLGRKTVEQVWFEIQRNSSFDNGGQTPGLNPDGPHKQTTFGEMTLEEFLVKAGVVREQQNLPPAILPPPQHIPMGMPPYQSVAHPALMPAGPNFVARPVMAMVGPNMAPNLIPSYQPLPQNGVAQTPPIVNYDARVVGNGVEGGFGQGAGLGVGMGSPGSPMLSDANQVDSGNQVDGRKRIIDGQTEKVVERRQRRMIKNRESAARSRARKQAYTVELEAELNQLREENTELKQTLVELEKKMKKQQCEEVRARKQKKQVTKTQRANEAIQVMRRSVSCPTVDQIKRTTCDLI